MNQGLPFKQSAGVSMIRNRKAEGVLAFRGKWHIEHFRNGKLFNIYDFLNDITNEGKNNILEVYFHSGTQTATANWFIGLISNTSYTALAPGDTMASHGGWTEFTGYSQTTRGTWGPGAAASQSITNATPVQFDINASGTVKGIFVVTNSTKSGTTGILWATALFPADVPVSNGDQLKCSYTLSC